MDFVECPTCMEKPGSPNLCMSCLTNRDTITALKAKVRTYEKEVSLLRTFCEGTLEFLAYKFLHKEQKW